MINVDEFCEPIVPVTRSKADKKVDLTLARELDRLFPVDGDNFAKIERACPEAIVLYMLPEGRIEFTE